MVKGHKVYVIENQNQKITINNKNSFIDTIINIDDKDYKIIDIDFPTKSSIRPREVVYLMVR